MKSDSAVVVCIDPNYFSMDRNVYIRILPCSKRLWCV